MQRIILRVLSIVTGLLFINGGLNKFLHYMPVPDDLPAAMLQDMAAIQEISWLLPLIAVAEIVGGLLLLFPRTRALGTLVLIPVAVGIVLTHLFVDPGQLVIPAVIWGVLLWIIVDDFDKFLPLLKSSGRRSAGDEPVGSEMVPPVRQS